MLPPDLVFKCLKTLFPAYFNINVSITRTTIKCYKTNLLCTITSGPLKDEVLPLYEISHLYKMLPLGVALAFLIIKTEELSSCLYLS